MTKQSQAVLNQVGDQVAIIVTDISGNVTAFNKGAEELSGYSLDEVITRPAPIHHFDRLSQQIKQECYETLEGQLRHKLGHAVAVKITASTITDHKNNTNGFLFMATTNKAVSDSFDIKQLANAEIFQHVFENEFNRMQRLQQPLALLKIDIDGYTRYKRAHGEEKTQYCLNQIAYVLNSRVKRAGDFLAYMGHDEFMIVLPHTDKSGAVKMAEYLRLLVVALDISDSSLGRNSKITISLGIAHGSPSVQTQPQQLLQQAEDALRRDKDAGRNCSRLSDDG